MLSFLKGIWTVRNTGFVTCKQVEAACWRYSDIKEIQYNNQADDGEQDLGDVLGI
jgi:hypothetical protein